MTFSKFLERHAQPIIFYLSLLRRRPGTRVANRSYNKHNPSLFSNLPLDISQLIVEIAAQGDNETGASLCRTSRIIRGWVVKLLYREIYIKTPKQGARIMARMVRWAPFHNKPLLNIQALGIAPGKEIEYIYICYNPTLIRFQPFATSISSWFFDRLPNIKGVWFSSSKYTPGSVLENGKILDGDLQQYRQDLRRLSDSPWYYLPAPARSTDEEELLSP